MAVVSATEVAVDLIARQDKLSRQLDSAGRLVDRSLGSMESRGRQFADRFSSYLAGFAVGAIVRELGQLADQAKQLDAQLKLATAGLGNFAQAQEDVRRIATVTRGSLDATAKLYGGFVRAAQETGRSQADAARATETFAKALKIGGASAEEAASATLQFNQALQSGTLRGDEFNSIMEASPRVARLLADALGVPIGALRKMAEEGKITTDVLFRALNERRFTAGIDGEFKQLPKSIGEAMQAIHNAAVVTFGAFDKGGQFSNAITNLLTEGTDTFAGLEKLATDFGKETRAVFAGLEDVFGPLLAGAQSAFGGIRQQANYARDSIANILRAYDNVDNLLINIGNFGTRADNALKRGLNKAIDRAGGGQHFQERALTPQADRAGQFLRGFDASTRQTDARLAADARAANRNAPARTAARTGSAATPSKGGKSTAHSAAADAAKAADDLALYLRRFSISTTDVDTPSRSEREAAAARSFENVFGEEGRDFADPFASVRENDRLRAIYFDGIEEAEQRAQDLRERNVHQLADTFETLFQQGTDGVWRSFKDQGLRAIALIAAQAVATSFGKDGGGLGSLLGNIGSAASSVFGGQFGGARALGGPVAAGKTYLVGERGPELLRMAGASGTVIPNNQLMVAPALPAMNLGTAALPAIRGGDTVHYHVSVDARNSVNPDGFGQRIATAILTEADRMDARRQQTARKTFPAVQSRYASLGTTGS